MSKDLIKTLKIQAPEEMQYYVSIENAKDRKKFVDRIEKIVRSSMEYRDYINFIKTHLSLDKCVFFQHVTSNKNANNKGRVSIELHHEPFTLYDYVTVVLSKYEQEGLPINDLLIADEVLKLHYDNSVGLIPLSKTMHQVIHNSDKVIIPLNMVYGEYSKFLEEYADYIEDELYDKLQRKLDMTKKLTEESFEALKKQFTYVEVNGFDKVQKQEIASEEIA